MKYMLIKWFYNQVDVAFAWGALFWFAWSFLGRFCTPQTIFKLTICTPLLLWGLIVLILYLIARKITTLVISELFKNYLAANPEKAAFYRKFIGFIISFPFLFIIQMSIFPFFTSVLLLLGPMETKATPLTNVYKVIFDENDFRRCGNNPFWCIYLDVYNDAQKTQVVGKVGTGDSVKLLQRSSNNNGVCKIETTHSGKLAGWIDCKYIKSSFDQK